MTTTWIAAASLALILAAPAVAAAQDDITVIACQPHDAAREQADLDIAAKGMDAIQAFNQGKGDLAGLQALLPGIESALTHAPDRPSRPEKCGDTIILYSGDLMQMLILSAAMEKHAEMGAVSIEQREPLPYALLAFEAGWIHFEAGDYAAAHAAYARGLLNNPDDATLVSEDSYALAQLMRDDEALALVDDFLAGHLTLADGQAALLQRKRGYILVDLNRLDEAEAAYRRSLELEPGNATALEELDYIAKQRAKN